MQLQAKHLHKSYKKRQVVSDVSIQVSQGEIVGLLGPNGAGKTTTFLMTVGLIKPDEGEIWLDDAELTHLPMFKRARHGVGYLAQDASVFEHLTVEDNIKAVLQFQRLTKGAIQAKIDHLIAEFGLEKIRQNKGYALSGGERRRTEIARALATEPKFLLLDEPFAGVDPIAVEEIQRIVADLKHKNIGILITDHNVHETLAITDRAYLLSDGKIFLQGTSSEIAHNEEARRKYLGEKFSLERYI